jgi:hypothetical protein
MTTNIARGTVFVTLRTWLNEYPLCDHEPEYQANIEEDDDATVHCYLLERFVWSTSSCCPHVDCDFIVPSRENTILGMVGDPGPMQTSSTSPAMKRQFKCLANEYARSNLSCPFPSQGELAHPFEGWIIEKAATYEYMPNYAKKQGFGVNIYKEWQGHIIRWRLYSLWQA